MAVDRGGLQYTIRLRDEFSKTTAKFKSELRSSKAAFAEFQRGVQVQRDAANSFKKTAKAIDEQQAAVKRLAEESKRQRALERESVKIRNTQQRDSTRATRDRIAAERAAAKESEKLVRQEQANLKASVDAKNKATKEATRISAQQRKDEARALADQQKALKSFSNEQLKREKEVAKIAAAQRRDEKAVQNQDVQFQAQKRLNSALQEEAISRSQINILRTRAQAQFAKGDILGGAKSLKQAKDLEASLQSVNKSGNNLFFTFRRLVGILAIFTIARNVVQGFQDLVKAGIDFNNVIESAKTSIAGLLVATADVRNQFGLGVDSAQEFVLALSAADDQIKKLQKDSLRTVATFQQLVETFQIAVAPGFAAGLNLDQIRKLTVSISQAASAIGLQQNQLAEEIRSLLSGTIQARTTRIATALGITNADVRRLKETGKLFDFLEEKFKGFNIANERLVRSTLSGVQNLITNIVQRILGQAAEPLFNELIKLGNEFLDKVLTIRDATGELQVNPAVVQSFKFIFDALRDGLLEVKRVGKELGLDNIKTAFQAAGTALSAAIQFAIGFAQQFLSIFIGVVKVIRSVANFVGVTDSGLGKIAATLGVILATSIAWNNTFGLLGVKVADIASFLITKIPGGMKGLITSTGIWAAIIAAAVVGFDLVLSNIFDVNLTLVETIKLLKLGLVDTLKDAVLGIRALALQFKGAFTGQTQEQIDDQLRPFAEARIAQQKEFEQEIADITVKAAERANRGPGFDPFAKAKQSAQGFSGIVSGINSQVQQLAATIQSLDDDIFKVGAEFRAAFDAKDLQGVGAKIQEIFSARDVKSAEDLKKIRATSLTVEKQIAAIIQEQQIGTKRRIELELAASGDLNKKQIEALKITDAEAQLVSLFQDQAIIKETLNQIDQKSLDLALKKAAILAVETSREMNREAILLRAQLAAERAITQVVANRLGARRQAVVEAQNALNLAQVEQSQAEKSLQDQIAFLQEKIRLANRTGENAPTAAEREALNGLLQSLQGRLALEQAIGAEKLRQLDIARQEAALVESGSAFQGIQRGFEQLVNELPSAFEAGIAIVKQSVQSLTDFISSSIVSAFDPTDDTDLQERFARFLQGIANIILQQIIQLAIASAIQKTLGETQAGAVEVAAATTAASIKVTAAQVSAATEIAAAQAAAAIRIASGGVGLHSGGLVKGYNSGGPVTRAGKAAMRAHAVASGYARGGRPAGLHPSDTVPAWLQPGEFVLRKSVVDQLDMGWLKNLNNGDFAVAPAAPPSGAHAAAGAGMAKGGLVSEQLQQSQVAPRNESDSIKAIGVLVAKEKEADRFFAGGKNALLRLIKDNAGSINGILGRGR